MSGRTDRWWIGLWTKPASPLALGLSRIAVGSYLLYYVWVMWATLPRLHGQPASGWSPNGPAILLARPPTPTEVQILLAVTAASGVLFVAGVAWRVVAPVFVLTSLLALSLRSSWGMLFHNHHLAGLHALALAAAVSAGSPSVDGWLRGRVPDWLVGPALDPAGDSRAAWPVRLAAAVTALTYWVAGVAKVVHGGWGWVTGGNLRDQIGKDALNRLLYVRDFDTSIVELVYAHQGWLWFGALVTMVVELGAPLFLRLPRLAIPWVIGALSMHWGIWMLMDILFAYPTYGLAFVCVVVLDPTVADALVGLHRRWLGPPG